MGAVEIESARVLSEQARRVKLRRVSGLLNDFQKTCAVVRDQIRGASTLHGIGSDGKLILALYLGPDYEKALETEGLLRTKRGANLTVCLAPLREITPYLAELGLSADADALEMAFGVARDCILEVLEEAASISHRLDDSEDDAKEQAMLAAFRVSKGAVSAKTEEWASRWDYVLRKVDDVRSSLSICVMAAAAAEKRLVGTSEEVSEKQGKGHPRLEEHKFQERVVIAAEWHRAKAAGIKKAVFASELGLSEDDIDNALDVIGSRKRRADKKRQQENLLSA